MIDCDRYEAQAEEGELHVRQTIDVIRELRETRAALIARMGECTTLTAERDTAIARAERAEAERTEYLAALWLCAYETAWVRTHQDSKTFACVIPYARTEGPPALLINCNDTFAWACADCEPCEYPRASEVFRIMEAEGWAGVDRWVQAQRRARGEGAEFIEPVAKAMGTLDAMRARAEAAEALAASRPEITTTDAREACAHGLTVSADHGVDVGTLFRIERALRAHAAKVSR